MDPAPPYASLPAHLTRCAGCAVVIARNTADLSCDGDPICPRCFAAWDLAATERRAADEERARDAHARNDLVGEIAAVIVAAVVSS